TKPPHASPASSRATQPPSPSQRSADVCASTTTAPSPKPSPSSKTTTSPEPPPHPPRADHKKPSTQTPKYRAPVMPNFELHHRPFPTGDHNATVSELFSAPISATRRKSAFWVDLPTFFLAILNFWFTERS